MSLRKSIKNKKGSYIAEAALTLPVFILCVVALALIIRIIAVCENIGFVTSKTVRAIGLNEYYSSNEYNIAASLCKFSLEEAVKTENKKLTDFSVTNFDYLYTDKGIEDLIGVDTRAVFKVLNPIGIKGKIEFTQGILTRAFTGKIQKCKPLEETSFNDRNKSQTVVIFPKYGVRFHIKNCRYVKQEYEGEEEKLKMEREDALRKGYTACIVCGGGADG